MFGIFICSFIITLILSVPALRILRRLQVYDSPNRRSLHHNNVLRMGGIIFTCGYLTTIALIFLFDKSFYGQLGKSGSLFLFSAVLLIFALGICDDLYNLKARTKLFFECLAGLMLYRAGIRFEMLNFAGFQLDLDYLTMGFTIFWTVGVLNITNLLDGLDGLAAGFSLIVLIYLQLTGPVSPAPFAVINAALTGAVAAFLIFNFHPAKVFMGDSGSLILGLHIAILLMKFPAREPGNIGTLALLLPLALPLTDTFMAIYRRSKSGRSIFQADRLHIHHRLYKSGMSQKQVALLLYLCSAIFCLISFLGQNPQNSPWLIAAVGFLGAALLAGLPVFLEKIHQHGQKEGRKKLLLYNIKSFLSEKNEQETFLLYREHLEKVSEPLLLKLQNEMLRRTAPKRKELLRLIIETLKKHNQN